MKSTSLTTLLLANLSISQSTSSEIVLGPTGDTLESYPTPLDDIKNLDAQSESCLGRIKTIARLEDAPVGPGTIQYLTGRNIDFETRVDGNIFCSNAIDTSSLPHRGLILVDTKSDPKLSAYINDFNIIFNDKSTTEKFKLLMSYVKNFFGPENYNLEIKNEPQRLGDYPNYSQAICIHHAILTKLLADATEGLSANLMFGTFSQGGSTEFHVWNELIISDDSYEVKYLFDTAMGQIIPLSFKESKVQSNKWTDVQRTDGINKFLSSYATSKGKEKNIEELIKQLTDSSREYLDARSQYLVDFENGVPEYKSKENLNKANFLLDKTDRHFQLLVDLYQKNMIYI